MKRHALFVPRQSKLLPWFVSTAEETCLVKIQSLNLLAAFIRRRRSRTRVQAHPLWKQRRFGRRSNQQIRKQDGFMFCGFGGSSCASIQLEYEVDSSYEKSVDKILAEFPMAQRGGYLQANIACTIYQREDRRGLIFADAELISLQRF